MKKFKFNKIYKLPKTSGVYAIVNSLNGLIKRWNRNKV